MKMAKGVRRGRGLRCKMNNEWEKGFSKGEIYHLTREGACLYLGRAGFLEREVLRLYRLIDEYPDSTITNTEMLCSCIVAQISHGLK